MRIQAVSNDYKLPFNPKKVIHWPWARPPRNAHVLEVYVIIVNATYSYYSIAHSYHPHGYLVLRHGRRRPTGVENRVTIEYESNTYTEAIRDMGDTIKYFKQSYNPPVLIDVIHIQEDNAWQHGLTQMDT
jgi:hypothetical protein